MALNRSPDQQISPVMQDIPPPSFICYSLADLEEIDDASELTGPCRGDNVLSQERNFTIRLADGPRYHPHCLQTMNRRHPSWRTEIHQEVLELKKKIAKQQDKHDELSCKLSQCEAENKVLKAEKAVLVDKLAVPTKEQYNARRGGFGQQEGNGGGSLQMLIDTNSKLMTDNARLQVLVDVMRVCFKSYIEVIQLNNDNDQQVIETPAREDGLPQKRPGAPDSGLSRTNCSGQTPKFSAGSFAGYRSGRLSMSDRTAMTSLESSLTDNNPEELPINSLEHLNQESVVRNSMHSIPKQELESAISGDGGITEKNDIEGISNDGWILKCKDFELIENSVMRYRAELGLVPIFSGEEFKSNFSEGAAHNKSGELLVEFGEMEAPSPRRSTHTRLSNTLTEGPCSSLNDGLGACKKSDELLVGFSKSQRSQRRKWASFGL